MSAYGIITLYRMVEGLEGSMSTLRVLIDGAVAGRIRVGTSVEFLVAPGTHRVRLSWWCGIGSAPLVLDVQPGSCHHLLAQSAGLRDSRFRLSRSISLTVLSSSDICQQTQPTPRAEAPDAPPPDRTPSPPRRPAGWCDRSR
ncbi:hypothetical protein PUR71_11925 [Streptomyces sp. SP17BM10]|uniref:hypothetical protein n=1 Tax=Streptomyces sp. SP17BM10 TaxID=3002530 RepID=UPI002E7992FF|nr:hypothetical protein [Streptomyces sp. SP17BM10]MEE1783610.1 hypothetical protein [Streptomyces sp. SP17BM10]